VAKYGVEDIEAALTAFRRKLDERDASPKKYRRDLAWQFGVLLQSIDTAGVTDAVMAKIRELVEKPTWIAPPDCPECGTSMAEIDRERPFPIISLTRATYQCANGCGDEYQRLEGDFMTGRLELARRY
jgi:hypothetical protein